MLVFVDESGDCGIKGKAGSSQLFVIAAVIFEENLSAEACDKRVTNYALNASAEVHESFISTNAAMITGRGS